MTRDAQFGKPCLVLALALTGIMALNALPSGVAQDGLSIATGTCMPSIDRVQTSSEPVAPGGEPKLYFVQVLVECDRWIDPVTPELQLHHAAIVDRPYLSVQLGASEHHISRGVTGIATDWTYAYSFDILVLGDADGPAYEQASMTIGVYLNNPHFTGEAITSIPVQLGHAPSYDVRFETPQIHGEPGDDIIVHAIFTNTGNGFLEARAAVNGIIPDGITIQWPPVTSIPPAWTNENVVKIPFHVGLPFEGPRLENVRFDINPNDPFNSNIDLAPTPIDLQIETAAGTYGSGDANPPEPLPEVPSVGPIHIALLVAGLAALVRRRVV